MKQFILGSRETRGLRYFTPAVIVTLWWKGSSAFALWLTGTVSLTYPSIYVLYIPIFNQSEVSHLTHGYWYSLEAVRPSLELLEHVKQHLRRPVWINADILPGPNGNNTVVDAKEFLDTVTSFFPNVTLSLGWTTGWHPEKSNKGKDSKFNTHTA